MFGFKKKEETISYCKRCGYAYKITSVLFMHEGQLVHIDNHPRFHNLCSTCINLEFKKYSDDELVREYVKVKYKTILAAAKKYCKTLKFNPSIKVTK